MINFVQIPNGMRKLLLLTVLISVIAGCNKYPDGPKFTLKTKRSRMAGVWDLQETVQSDGSTYVDPNDYITTLKKNKEMTIETANGSYTGSWSFFAEDEQVRFAYNGIYVLYRIKRLMKKELWLQDMSNGDLLKFKNLDN